MAANSRGAFLTAAGAKICPEVCSVIWALTFTQTTAPSPALWSGDPWGSCKFAASLQIHNCELRTSLKILSGIGSSRWDISPNKSHQSSQAKNRESKNQKERERNGEEKQLNIMCPCPRASRRIFIKPFLWCLPDAAKKYFCHARHISKLPGSAKVCTCEPAFWNSACTCVRDVVLCLWLPLLHYPFWGSHDSNITHKNMARRAGPTNADTSKYMKTHQHKHTSGANLIGIGIGCQAAKLKAGSGQKKNILERIFMKRNNSDQMLKTITINAFKLCACSASRSRKASKAKHEGFWLVGCDLKRLITAASHEISVGGIPNNKEVCIF